MHAHAAFLLLAAIIGEPLLASETSDLAAATCMAALGEEQQPSSDMMQAYFFWIGRLNPAITPQQLPDLLEKSAERAEAAGLKTTAAGCLAEYNNFMDGFEQAERIIEDMRQKR
jgi:hypothetical protein